jgi:hypothetical protein
MKLNTFVGSLMLGASLCAPSFGGGLLDRMLGLKGSGCDSACCDTGCSADPSCGCEMTACGDACEPSCGVEIADCGSCDSGCKLGGGLLSRLGGKCAAPTCGCEIASACGAAPTCGCEMAPTCGCEIASSCGDGCAAPSCGCEIAAPCGCDSGCSKPRRKPLLELLGKLECKKNALFSRKSCGGCDTGCASACEPSCGVELGGCGCGAAPTCGCEIASSCGAAPSCGCEMASCGGCDSACGPKKCGGLLSKLFQRKNKSCCDTGCDSCGVVAGCSSCASSSAAPVAAPTIQSDAAPMPPAPIVDPSAYLQSNRRVVQATSYVR